VLRDESRNTAPSAETTIYVLFARTTILSYPNETFDHSFILTMAELAIGALVCAGVQAVAAIPGAFGSLQNSQQVTRVAKWKR
jgi:hypothetical protein